MHPFRQRTLRARATIEGVGLHSGANVRLTLCPAPVDSGIVFERADLSPRVEIPARAEYVCDTRLNTSLGKNGHKIGTVEHVLSALAGCGIDNARIEVEGPEVPIMDGSAAPFVQLVREAGLTEQRAARRYLLIKKPIEVRDGDKLARFVPARRFSIAYTIDFKHPLINDQSHRLEMNEKAFQKEIARARTFGFKRDVERLHAAGLARGGSLENAVVVDDFNILNPEGLRFPDEFVRHKILDAVGDISLIGMPVIGHLEAVKSGHAMNHLLVMKALTEVGASEVVRPQEEHELSAMQARVPMLAGLEVA
ncbi:MAG: UDP-3-O-acyl-N-acetylglucosamine deacetylase [Deltaproteobacteria bacterium]|nr:UDP-3-O-acyl-N-acetylglucosamine deacetylase [Deltaproteobacteria bacterium]